MGYFLVSASFARDATGMMVNERIATIPHSAIPNGMQLNIFAIV
jgi:hypothetical protein